MKRTRWILGFLVAGALSLGTAQAQQAEPLKSVDSAEGRAARVHYDQGQKFYSEKNYETARVEFEAAYRIYPAADFLYNIALCAQKQGRTKEELEYLERYVRAKRAEDGSSPSPAVKEELERLRAEQGQAPAPSPAPAPTPQLDPARSVERTQRPSGLAIGLMAGGGAVLLAGIGCGAAALALGLDVRDRPPQSFDELNPDLERGRALDRATIGLSVIGGVALGTGAAIWIVEGIKRRRSSPPTVAALRAGFAR